LFKIDKTLVDNMHQHKSFIVITSKNTPPKPPPKPRADLSEFMDEDMPPELKQKAQQLIEAAKAQANEIAAMAQVEAENIKAVAAEEGYREGIDGADEKFAENIEREIGHVKELMTRLYAYERELLEEMQESVMALAIDVAEKIINIQLKKDDIVFVGIVKEAISRLKKDERFALRVSRSEYDRFFKEGGAWLKDEAGCGEFDVIVDPEMRTGGCIVESDSKIIDAGVNLQIKKVKAAFGDKAE